jgi:hypothetical protein
LPTYTIPEQRRILELLDVRVAYTNAIHYRMYFAIPYEMGIDPWEFYAGDAFAEKRGYTASHNALSVTGRGIVSSFMNLTHFSRCSGFVRYCRSSKNIGHSYALGFCKLMIMNRRLL